MLTARPARVELHDPVALGVAHAVGEDRGPSLLRRGPPQRLREVVPVEDVVAQGQGHGVPAHEVAADEEGLGQPLRPRLGRVREAHAERAPVAEQALEAVLVVRAW